MSESQYPVLPLRDIVVFPSMVVPLFVGRQKSVRALQEVMSGDRQILLVAQKDGSQDDPDPGDLYGVGTVSTVLQLLKLPDDTVKVLVEGSHRAAITGFMEDEQCIRAAVSPFEESESDEGEQLALARAVTALFADYVKLAKKIPPEVVTSLEQIESPAKLVDTVASHLTIRIADKQELLEADSVTRRLERVYALIEGEISVRKVEKKIRGRVKQQMEKSQREYYLNEQMKAIQKELGEGEDGRDEVGEYEKRIDSTKLSKEARERSLAEVKKLRTMSPMSAEATVVRNYLDWMLGIPWKKRSKLKRDITNAEAILDADHFGLEKVKERIVEYLAVQARSRKLKGPILCLVGPPGVGKTSLGRSVARATGRKFVRMSLGGVRDEAEIRGHRRTYIGSMPGKILQGMKKAKTSNPLFLLDEVDKLGSDWRGDPSSALLEVLDPEQNVSFNDLYLEVDYDLSDVMFVTTANTTRIPQPLLDRMEVIRLSGYTEDEKVRIATDHLIAKQYKAHGLKDGEWSITEGALRDVIRYYTREAGVRNLEREIAKLQRKAVKQIVAGETTKVKVTSRNLEKFCGVRRYRFGEVEYDDMVGITSGLAYTDTGGELLSIEAVVLPGRGKMTITGKLGDVMQESVQAARSYLRARSPEFGLKPTVFDKRDIHVHVPEGATPKDGPSAGIAMFTSMLSALTGIPVKRTVAMTGEITLRGRVLPIGGLKEKLLAAHRSAIETVLIPLDNGKDLKEIPDNVKRGLNIITVSSVDDVVHIALAEAPVPVEWSDADVEEMERMAAHVGESGDVVTH
ncbi:MAG: endopeptidase La [Alphaproteobacteria bacterium]|nr:endopeptidase La [Alphaproteobacteria bacterium]